ncbi:P-loop NTPase family protein [Marinobacter salinisoli]|uniref:hypothetical protein n=1 Tax=Marinobacter salinisoli TaxID=2769486 RepID=UPI001D18A88E|nr:hypothetical protein [Marinobacter salinisoli]
MERFLEDWQGCLSPECQLALVQARDRVHERGGTVVTVEDYLLALLDSCAATTGFLQSAGVDLDELIRTVQCEQPVVTEVGSEGILSSQLLSWLSAAREVCDKPWLDWSDLLRVLASGMERLRDKAYVAVLELVASWPDTPPLLPVSQSELQSMPLVVTDSDWLSVAEDIAISVAASANALVWLRGKRGAGKSSLLRLTLAALEHNYRVVDPRNLAGGLDPGGVQSSREEAVCHDSETTVLVLDNCTPADVLLLITRESSGLPEMLSSWAGAILLVGDQASHQECAHLEHWLGRSLDIVDMPDTSEGQKEAILTAHQPVIEKRWQVEIPVSVIRFAAHCRAPGLDTPGGLLRWVEKAAARLNLFARRGPTQALALAGQAATIHRQSLVALARGESEGAAAASLDDLHLQKTAVEVAWHERQAAGALRQLCVADLRAELERWVAAKH